MNKYLWLLCVLMSAVLVTGTKAQTAPLPFSGLWVLDRAKTNTAKDFPEKLRDYRMLVGQDQDRLMVKAQVVGNVEVKAEGGQSARSGIASNPSNRTSVATPGGVSATTSTSSAESNSFVSYGGTMALFFTAQEITYDLTGKEIKVEPAAGDAAVGGTRIKAKPSKDGKSIELTAIRKMNGVRGVTEVITRETWKISDDGQTLKMQRTVQTPEVRDQIIMILAKKATQ